MLWRGGENLGPILLATGLSAESSRALRQFLAGISLGAAAAFLIAILQEIRAKRSEKEGQTSSG